jgi:hypothetical protein
MAEKEQNFRHTSFPKALNKLFILSIVWMITSFIIVLSLLYSSYLLIERGENIEWIVLLLWAISTISFPFIFKWVNAIKDDYKNKKLKK